MVGFNYPLFCISQVELAHSGSSWQVPIMTGHPVLLRNINRPPKFFKSFILHRSFFALSYEMKLAPWITWRLFFSMMKLTKTPILFTESLGLGDSNFCSFSLLIFNLKTAWIWKKGGKLSLAPCSSNKYSFLQVAAMKLLLEYFRHCHIFLL